MARYSRRRGPPADFELSGGAQIITGLSITRFWDHGEILLLVNLGYSNNIVGNAVVTINVALDGISPFLVVPQWSFTHTFFANLSLQTLIPTTEGVHTIDIIGTGNPVASDIILANKSTIVAIQLPLWDDPANIQ